jgi:hypothetical protein
VDDSDGGDVAIEELGDLLGKWVGVHIKNSMNEKFTKAAGSELNMT